MRPIVLLGFGRSGTTWVSDIISKSTGTLLLFEPFHPSVIERSKDFAYSIDVDVHKTDFLKIYFYNLLKGKIRRKWLMRNHVPYNLNEISETFLDGIWDECKIAGFKSIRSNFLIEWYRQHLDAKIVFIMRHPCAVIASILKKTNFWEFGWPGTYELFISKTVYSSFSGSRDLNDRYETIKNTQKVYQNYAIMWAITHAIALPILKNLNIPVLFYEDIYRSPFVYSKKLLNYLGHENIHIHPSYLFTPSMTSIKTVHGLYGKDDDIANKGASAFWEGVLSDKEIEEILYIANLFGVDSYDKSGLPLKKNLSF